MSFSGRILRVFHGGTPGHSCVSSSLRSYRSSSASVNDHHGNWTERARRIAAEHSPLHLSGRIRNNSRARLSQRLRAGAACKVEELLFRKVIKEPCIVVDAPNGCIDVSCFQPGRLPSQTRRFGSPVPTLSIVVIPPAARAITSSRSASSQRRRYGNVNRYSHLKINPESVMRYYSPDFRRILDRFPSVGLKILPQNVFNLGC